MGARGQKQSGLTLVEVMVGAVISLVLLNGVIQIFLSSKQTYRFGDAISRLQEGGRFAMDLLTRDIRMAGYQGCADLSAVPANVIANTPPVGIFNTEAVQGWEVGTTSWTPASPAQPADLTALVKKNTDVISVKHASDLGVMLTGNMLSDNANIQITGNTAGFKKDDVLFISDCETVDVFRATTVSSGSGTVTIAHANSTNSTNKLSKAYGTNTTVYSFDSNYYYVADTGRTNSRAQKIYGLFKRDINGAISEIVEGVENMQVLYGERLSNGTIRYVAANNGTLVATNIVSVRIGLLLHSTEPVNQDLDNTTYSVLGTDVKPVGTSGAVVTHEVDKRLRRVFVSTIKLRNRR